MAADRSWCSDDRVLDEADLVLVLRDEDGRKVLALQTLLALASPVLQTALKCGVSSGSGSSRKQKKQKLAAEMQQEEDLPCLTVDGSFKGWAAVLRHLCQPLTQEKPAKLTLASAYHVLPIAHAYDMTILLKACVNIARQSLLPLGCLSQAYPRPEDIEDQKDSDLGISESSEGEDEGQSNSEDEQSGEEGSLASELGEDDIAERSGSEEPQGSEPRQASPDTADGPVPDLLQWLELGDSRQYRPLVQVCVDQLIKQGGVAMVDAALKFHDTNTRLEKLSGATMIELLRVVATAAAEAEKAAQYYSDDEMY